MTVAAGLIGYAFLLAVLAPPVLRRGWILRAPRLAIAGWQAASAAFVLALVLAGLSAAVPTADVAGGLAGLLRSCAEAIRAAYATPGGALAALAGLTLAAGVAIRAAGCVAQALRVAGRRRRGHAATLRLVGRDAPDLGATVLDNDAPAVYCLPGRTRRVVLTTGALAALSDEEVAAVLAHERAHIAGRHHLVLAVADGLAAAFPVVPLLAAARPETGRLIEMLADDAATRRHARGAVASALVALATATTPASALAAGGSAALTRVRRLLSPARPLGGARSAAGFGLVAVVLAVPLGAAALPAAAVSGLRYCPVTATHTTHEG